MAATGRRYAQAAFELAKDHNSLDVWEEGLARASEVLLDPDVLGFLDAPQVTDSAKLDGIFKIIVINRVLGIFKRCEIGENKWRGQKVKNSLFFLPCIKLPASGKKRIHHSYFRIKILVLLIAAFAK